MGQALAPREAVALDSAPRAPRPTASLPSNDNRLRHRLERELGAQLRHRDGVRASRYRKAPGQLDRGPS